MGYLYLQIVKCGLASYCTACTLELNSYTKEKKCTAIECNQVNCTACTLEEMFWVGLFFQVAGQCPLKDMSTQ